MTTVLLIPAAIAPSDIHVAGSMREAMRQGKIEAQATIAP
jgi:hypothetical protein